MVALKKIVVDWSRGGGTNMTLWSTSVFVVIPGWVARVSSRSAIRGT